MIVFFQKEYDYGLLSKYRSIIMGCAIVGITLCHLDTAQKHNGVDVTLVAAILHLLTVGVDVFMLYSGLGLYYSFSKRKQTYWEYLSKRVSRLFPSYFVIAGITGIVSTVFINGQGWFRFFENLFFFSWFKYGSTIYWFILGIFAFYLIFPIVYKVFETDDYKRCVIFLVLILSVFYTVTAIAECYVPSYRWFKIAIERFPIFVLGIFLGKLSKNEKKISIVSLCVLFFVGLSLIGLQFLLNSYSFWVQHVHYAYYFNRGLFAISIIILIIMVMEFFEQKVKKIGDLLTKAFSFLGGVTLEIYLLHQSSMILFNYPPNIFQYLMCASVLPISGACVWNVIRTNFAQKRGYK